MEIIEPIVYQYSPFHTLLVVDTPPTLLFTQTEILQDLLDALGVSPKKASAKIRGQVRKSPRNPRKLGDPLTRYTESWEIPSFQYTLYTVPYTESDREQ